MPTVFSISQVLSCREADLRDQESPWEALIPKRTWRSVAAAAKRAGQAHCAPTRPALSCEKKRVQRSSLSRTSGGTVVAAVGGPLGCVMLAGGRWAQGPTPGPSTPGAGSGCSTSGA